MFPDLIFNPLLLKLFQQNNGFLDLKQNKLLLKLANFYFLYKTEIECLLKVVGRD
jgi:hypothetical protein